jgi:hypothetical protein
MQSTVVDLRGKGSNPKTALYVGGLEETVNEATLHAAFLPFGDLADVSVPMDHATGKHRGFGFVQFESKDDAADAIDNMHNAGAAPRRSPRRAAGRPAPSTAPPLPAAASPPCRPSPRLQSSTAAYCESITRSLARLRAGTRGGPRSPFGRTPTTGAHPCRPRPAPPVSAPAPAPACLLRAPQTPFHPAVTPVSIICTHLHLERAVRSSLLSQV